MILVMTIAYARHGFVRQAIEYFQAHTDRSEYTRHVIVDPGYPIPGNAHHIGQIAAKHDLEYLAIENLGCHQNWNYVLNHYNLGEGDILVGVCPDTRGENPGWVKASVDVLRADSDCFTVQLNRHEDYSKIQKDVRVVGGHEVIHFDQLVAWSCGSFNCGIIKSIGGFGAYNEQYGYGEQWLVDKLPEKRWYFLKNHFDNCVGSPDVPYTLWKIQSAGQVTKLPFDQWLRVQG